jgi:hypothetical protein
VEGTNTYLFGAMGAKVERRAGLWTFGQTAQIGRFKRPENLSFWLETT